MKWPRRGPRWGRNIQRDPEIAPDEIFLDASNASEFDRARLEGRLEKSLPRSTFIVLAGTLGILFLVLVVRAGDLQLVNGRAFAEQSAHNSLEAKILFAPRGVIADSYGVALAENIQLPDGTIGRRYPVPSLGQIIGYVSYPKKDAQGVYYDTDQKGLAGLEKIYDAELAGKN